MTVEQKARQLALTLVGEDQTSEPLIEVLMDMAAWQREQMMKCAVEAEVKAWGVIGYVGTLLKIDTKIDGLDVYDRVKVIILKTK
jgi:hypothetical protein